MMNKLHVVCLYKIFNLFFSSAVNYLVLIFSFFSIKILVSKVQNVQLKECCFR